METPSQKQIPSAPPSSVDYYKQRGAVMGERRELFARSWRSLFDPTVYEFEEMRQVAVTLTPPFDLEVNGSELKQLDEHGELFGPDLRDGGPIYTRHQLSMALEAKARIAQFARGADMVIKSDIDRLLALHTYLNLLFSKHPEFYIENGHLVQSPEEEKDNARFDPKFFMNIACDFDLGFLPLPEEMALWIAHAQKYPQTAISKIDASEFIAVFRQLLHNATGTLTAEQLRSPLPEDMARNGVLIKNEPPLGVRRMEKAIRAAAKTACTEIGRPDLIESLLQATRSQITAWMGMLPNF